MRDTLGHWIMTGLLNMTLTDFATGKLIHSQTWGLTSYVTNLHPLNIVGDSLRGNCCQDNWGKQYSFRILCYLKLK